MGMLSRVPITTERSRWRANTRFEPTGTRGSAHDVSSGTVDGVAKWRGKFNRGVIITIRVHMTRITRNMTDGGTFVRTSTAPPPAKRERIRVIRSGARNVKNRYRPTLSGFSTVYIPQWDGRQYLYSRIHPILFPWAIFSGYFCKQNFFIILFERVEKKSSNF